MQFNTFLIKFNAFTLNSLRIFKASTSLFHVLTFCTAALTAALWV